MLVVPPFVLHHCIKEAYNIVCETFRDVNAMLCIGENIFYTRKEGLLSHCISTANSNVADNIKDMEGSNLAQEIKHQR